MPRPNRVHLRVLTLLLIAALALPGFALAAPAPLADAAPDLPLRDALTAHMTPERQQLAFQQTVAALDAWSDQIEQRPPVDPAVQMQQTADWTVLVYIAGDNNLEAMGLLDLNEMEAVGSSPDVNIVAIDYDSGATRINQENRLKLMLANAPEVRAREDEADAAVPDAAAEAVYR